MDKTINFSRKSPKILTTRSTFNRVAKEIIKNVDNESCCPELKRVFDNTGAAIIGYCKKARNEIPEERTH